MEARTLLVLGDAGDLELPMRNRVRKALTLDDLGWHERPALAAGDAAREHAHVVGVARDRERDERGDCRACARAGTGR